VHYLLILGKQGFYLFSIFIQHAAAIMVIRKDITASERCEQLRGKSFLQRSVPDVDVRVW
jgi:hypothetical protein